MVEIRGPLQRNSSDVGPIQAGDKTVERRPSVERLPRLLQLTTIGMGVVGARQGIIVLSDSDLVPIWGIVGCVELGLAACVYGMHKSASRRRK